MNIAQLHKETRTNLPFYDERVDLACAFRWTARLNMHEAVANHFSLAVNDDGTHFLMNPNQVHFSRIKASDLLLIDANDPETMNRPERAGPDGLGPAWRHPPQRAACALRHACAFDPCDGARLAGRLDACRRSTRTRRCSSTAMSSTPIMAGSPSRKRASAARSCSPTPRSRSW